MKNIQNFITHQKILEVKQKVLTVYSIQKYGKVSFGVKTMCFAVGFVSSGNEFVLHLYLVCFRIRWGY